MFALHRYFDPSYEDGQIGKTQFVETAHGFLDATLANSGQLDFPPQFALHPDGWFLCALGPDQDRAEQLLARVRAVHSEQVHRSIRDVPEHSPARLILRGKNIQLRARSEAEADRLLAQAAAAQSVDDRRPFEPLTLPETMSLRMSVDPNSVGRCIAKMAFNMATAVLGPSVVLGDQFNPVRAYILGTDVQEGPTVTEDGEAGVLVDYRYVEPWLNRPSRPPVASTRVHTIELVKHRGGLGAFVGLFGASEWFAVRLGPLDGLDTRLLGTRLMRGDDDDYWQIHGVWVSWKRLRKRGASVFDVVQRLDPQRSGSS